MKRKRIKWRFYVPLDFPCMVEGCNDQAEYSVKLRSPLEITFYLCERCSKLTEEEIRDVFLLKGDAADRSPREKANLF